MYSFGSPPGDGHAVLTGVRLSDRSKAVFLSYSSDDQAAAERLCEGLAAAGIETWLDRSELRGGDAWDAHIRRQIHECALFVPMISASTESRSEGHFRLEWRLAVERSLHFADDQAFLMPVVIDGTTQSTARVPTRFRERQWSALPGGTPTPQFIARVRELLAGATVATAPAEAAAGVAPGRSRSRAWRVVLAAGVLGAALVLTWLHRGAGSGAPAGAAGVADRKSIAVLPFANLTGHPEDAYLADGLQEEILNALARIRDLKVISRTSVAGYRGSQPNMREISSRLGVGTVLEGSVRRDGNTMRLTTQLIDARDDRHLLATNYDRDLGHILGLQSEVARAVAEALTATLTANERGELEQGGTNNGDAYREYLKAVALFMQEVPGDDAGVLEPARRLEEAVRLDPEFADAYALLSRVYAMKYVRTEAADDAERCRLAFQRALAIDPQLIDARLARGQYELYIERDLDHAFADLDTVARLRPNSPATLQAMGFVLRRRGRWVESLPYFERASALDPLNAAYIDTHLLTLLAIRHYPEALALTEIRRRRFPADEDSLVAAARISAFMTQSLEPLHALLRHPNLKADTRRDVEAQIAATEGRYRDAIALWEARTDAYPVERGENLAFLYRAAGDAVQAQQRFHEVAQVLTARLSGAANDLDDIYQQLALVQSMLGDHAAAIATIETARGRWPESLDPVNGPPISFYRSVILARAGRTAEAYAEVERLLHVPNGTGADMIFDPEAIYFLLKDDPHFDTLIHHPPRL